MTAALAFTTISSSLVYAEERPSLIALGGFIGAMISVTAGFLIISRFGAWGAVWSRLFLQGSMIALLTWFIVTRLHFSYPFRSLGRTVMVAGLCSLCAWGMIHLVNIPYVALVTAVPVGVVVYMLSVRLFRVLGPEEVRQLKRIADRLPTRANSPIRSMLDAMAGTQ